MITCDSRERLPAVLSASDGQRLLQYEDVSGGGAILSYDLEVTLADGGVLRVERKALRSDAVASWSEGKLPRQLSAVDLFVVEMPDMFELAVAPLSAFEQNFLRHLEVLNLSIPVWRTDGPADTMARLRALSKREGGIAIRPNRVEGSGSRESVRQAIVRAVMAGSGHSPSRETPAGTVGAQVERLVDWAGVAKAMRLESWREGAQWAGRVPSETALAKMAGRIAGAGEGATSPPASHPAHGGAQESG